MGIQRGLRIANHQFGIDSVLEVRRHHSCHFVWSEMVSAIPSGNFGAGSKATRYIGFSQKRRKSKDSPNDKDGRPR